MNAFEVLHMKEYEALVIGAGQGGIPLALKLADLGWRVALIEREYVGGSCINYGCTPTKTMMAHARVAHVVRRAAEFGLDVGEVTIDLPRIVARKRRIVQAWRKDREKRVAAQKGLDLYRAHARFTGPTTVLADGVELASERIFIDTGTRPHVPSIRGIDEIDVLTNRTIMDLDEIPSHLLVLGGSYVGLEFGQMFLRFGSQVTVLEHNERIIAHEDPEVSEAVHAFLADEGMGFHLGATARSVRRTGNGIALALTTIGGAPLEVTGTHLLAASGRMPNTDDMGLDQAGVETDSQGFIRVNERLETSVHGIWAIGDVKGGPAFTHISYDDHLVIYDNLIGEGGRTTDGRLVPYALFTDPELGRVGMSERQAREAGYRLKTGRIPMAEVARALERDETVGFMKVVIDADTDRVLGASVLAPEGGEIVQIFMTLMMANAPWTLLKRAIYIHPTLAEGLFGLMESVAEADGQKPALA